MHSLIRHRFSVRDPDQYFQQVLGINSLYAFTVPSAPPVKLLQLLSSHFKAHGPAAFRSWSGQIFSAVHPSYPLPLWFHVYFNRLYLLERFQRVALLGADAERRAEKVAERLAPRKVSDISVRPFCPPPPS